MYINSLQWYVNENKKTKEMNEEVRGSTEDTTILNPLTDQVMREGAQHLP